MGRPSNEALLEKAIAEGDVNKAQEIVAKLAKKRKKPTKKNKEKVQGQGFKTKRDDSSYIAPSRPNGRDEKVVGGDEDKNYGRRMLWSQEQRPNTFTDVNVLTKKQEKSVRKFDKKYPLSHDTQRREPSELVEVVCGGCGRKEMVAPSLACRRVAGEEIVYKCNKCCHVQVG